MTVVPPFMLKWDVNEGGSTGDLFAIELPPGEYEFYAWRIGSGHATVQSKQPFHVRFTVVAGKAIYVGNFHFKQTRSFGLTVTGAELSLEDLADRDVPLLQRKYPALAATGIEKTLPAKVAYRNLGDSYDTTIVIPLPVIVPVRR